MVSWLAKEGRLGRGRSASEESKLTRMAILSPFVIDCLGDRGGRAGGGGFLIRRGEEWHGE